VWQVLGAVKTEFGKFGDVLAKTKKKLDEASKHRRGRGAHARHGAPAQERGGIARGAGRRLAARPGRGGGERRSCGAVGTGPAQGPDA
jgi:hypothetical protein